MNYPYNNLENFTLRALLNRSIELYKDEKALGIVGQEIMTYSEFMQKVELTIKLLQDNGISKGDKVLLLSENMPNWGVAYFAITYFGAVAVPLLVDFNPADIHHIIRHSEAKAIIVSTKQLHVIEEDEKKDVEFVINLDNLEIMDEFTNKNYISKLKEMANKFSHDTSVKEDDLAVIIYTSGTTGHSKGVMLSHKNLVTNALSAYDKIVIDTDDVFLSILPLAHTYECTVGLIIPILHGASIYYIQKAPTPSVLLKSFSLINPTIIVSVPLIIEKIYKSKILPNFTSSFMMRTLYSVGFIRKKLNKMAGKKLIQSFGGNLKLFAIGGAKLSSFVEEFLYEAEFPYKIGYGLTETSPMIAGSSLNGQIKVKSTGPSMAGVEIAIKDKDPITGNGEIITKSSSVMMGYYKDKEKTAEVMDGEWFLTGDLGYIDDDGYLFINGRSKNVIIGASGENIYPEQVESIIDKNKLVLESLVMMKDSKLIARIHLDYEQIDKLFNADQQTDAKVSAKITGLLETMRLDINKQVSSFSKMTKFVEQREAFIKAPTKKIKRFLYED